MAKRQLLAIAALGAFFLASHLPFLPDTPASIDSVNFLMGVRDFNVADHRPHPPGAPVFIALGKVSEAVLGRAPVAADATRGDARSLAIWSALFGALAAFPLFLFFRSLEGDGRRAVAAAALTLTCPLFWFVAIRPMSDIPGLAVGLGAQALLVIALRRHEKGESATHTLAAGALVAGLAIGIRSQNAWLTVPLLAWTVLRVHQGSTGFHRAAMAFALGMLVWAVPLVIASGGPVAYASALMTQGREDLTGAEILATDGSLGRLVRAVVYTVAYPWANTALAATLIGLSAAGLITMLAYSRRGAMLITAAAVPYALFHLLFQEPVHTRYALPLVPAMAYLAVRGLDALLPRAMPWIAAGLAAAGVVLAFPPVVAYARTGSPVQRALADARERVSREGSASTLAMHHSIARMVRGEQLPLRMLPSVPRHEWLKLVEHWQRRPNSRIWFLAESGRRDLMLIDPTSRRLLRSYRWPFRRKYLMGRVPTHGIDWYEMKPPGWMAAEGWSLSTEAAGVASQDHRGPGERPIFAFVRRRQEAAVLMIGGRRLRGATEPRAHVELSLGRQLIDSWELTADSGSFLRMWELPAGALAGDRPYLPLWIRVTNAPPGSVAIDQFDLQSSGSLIYGYDSGWYQEEDDGAAPQPWRWTGRVSNVRVHHAGRDLMLSVTGEAPVKYLGGSPQISVRAGGEFLARVVPRDGNVRLDVRVPGSALSRAGGFLKIETDRTFVPDEVLGNGDRRELGVRIYRLELSEVREDVRELTGVAKQY